MARFKDCIHDRFQCYKGRKERILILYSRKQL